MVEVSIIVPVYNVEKYLAKCLDSCINQTFKDLEIICVNDGSTDRSLDILLHYQNLDSRIKIINKDNGGLSSSRNVGVNNAEGKYLLFLDSDDFLSSVAIEHLYKNAQSNSSDVVIFDFFLGHVNPSQRQILTISRWADNRYENKPFNADNIEQDDFLLIPHTAWLKLYRTEFLKQNNITFIEGIIYEDVPYFASVFTKAEKITYLKEPLYHYIIGRDGQIMGKNDETLFDIITVYKEFFAIFKQSSYFEKFKHSLYLLMMRDFLARLRIIRDDLKEKLFVAYKNIDFNIDYDYYDNYCKLESERVCVTFFKILNNTSTYQEFIEVVGWEK